MFKAKSSKTKAVAVGRHNVEVLKPLEQGGHSSIFLVRDTVTGEDMVLKKTTPQMQAQMDMAQKEVALNRQLKHVNIVQFRGDSIHESRRNGKKEYDVFLLMEYCPGGHLLDLVNNRRAKGSPLNESQVLKYFVQVCRAVDYLHRHKPPVAHRDIKLENVLVASGGRVKLCDFGSCSTTRVKCTNKQERSREEEIIDRYTTPFYRAPEMCDLYSEKTISEKVDVWALGCMLYALVFGKHAFEDGGKLGILNGKYSVPKAGKDGEEGVSKETLALIAWMLNTDPDQRPQVGDVMDFVESLTGTAKGDPAKERGSGIGERPVGFGGTTPPWRIAARKQKQKEEEEEEESEEASTEAKDKDPREQQQTNSNSGSSSRRSSIRKQSAGSVGSTTSDVATRNRSPSAALLARMARRSGSKSSASPNVPGILPEGVTVPVAQQQQQLQAQGGQTQPQQSSDLLVDLFSATSLDNSNNNAAVPVPEAMSMAPPPMQTPPQLAHQQPTQEQQQQHQYQQQQLQQHQQQMYQQQQWQQQQQQHQPYQQQHQPYQQQQQPYQQKQDPYQQQQQQQQQQSYQQQQQSYQQQQQQQRSRTSSASSNPFDTIDSTDQTSEIPSGANNGMGMATMPMSQMPLFYSNPGMQSSTISGFPVQPEMTEEQYQQTQNFSQHPQFFSNPGMR